MSFTWADGRKLSTITKGTNNYSYTYDSSGLRTSKTVNGTTTEYYWLNGMLQGQKTGSEHIIFLYDENGTAYGFLVYENGVKSGEYYYIFNAQGDVIGVLDSTGTKVVEYNYNVWGELLGITGTLKDTIGQKNPLRYRGYYFDSETGFYYLQSRYYDPLIGRFVNADGLISTGQGILGNNMFAYCGNNPVNYCDPSGESSLGIAIGVDILYEVIKAIVIAVSTYFIADQLVKNPPSFPSITLPESSSKSKSDSKTKEKDITASPPNFGTTYYHSTTLENVTKITSSKHMTGSKLEGGYVYAWKNKPSKYAIENSGAHTGVIISFKTNATFVKDTGITDAKVQMYGPVVSARKGPIVVWDVKIVGWYDGN